MDFDQTLKATKANVLIEVDMDNKTKYRFDNGTEIFISRGHNYNLREDAASVGKVLSAEKIPKGSMVLIHHNATQDSYKIFNLGKDNVFSVPNDQVFLFNDGSGWQPNDNFLITYRIFRRYKGLILGVEPERVEGRLYVIKGKIDDDSEPLDGKVAIVTPNSDYEIIFHENGKSKSIIRTRSREILAEDVEMTTEVNKGDYTSEYIIGNNSKDAQPLNYINHV